MSPRLTQDETVPIPTYEEAVGRSNTPSSFRGDREHDAETEREELLGSSSVRAGQRRRHGDYHTPYVESARTSEDSDLTLPEVEDEDDEELRHHMEEMDIVEPGTDSRPGRGRLRLEIPKNFARLRETLSFIQLPSFPDRWRSLSTFSFRMPFTQNRYKPNWPIIARFMALFVVVSLVYAMVVFRIFTMREITSGRMYPEETIRAFIQKAADREKLLNNLYEVSFDDHIAGTKGDFFLADWVQKKYLDAGLTDTFVTE